MTTSIIAPAVSPDLIITTPTQLLAAFDGWLKAFGFEEPEKSVLAAQYVDTLILQLKELNEGRKSG